MHGIANCWNVSAMHDGSHPHTCKHLGLGASSFCLLDTSCPQPAQLVGLTRTNGLPCHHTGDEGDMYGDHNRYAYSDPLKNRTSKVLSREWRKRPRNMASYVPFPFPYLHNTSFHLILHMVVHTLNPNPKHYSSFLFSSSPLLRSLRRTRKFCGRPSSQLASQIL